MSEPKTIDLMEALRNSLRADHPEAPDSDFRRPLGAPPVERVTFPRSRDDLTLDYMTRYRVDHQATMRAFVDRVLADLPAKKDHLAHGIAYEAAKAELKRPLRTPEHRLLAE